MCSSANQIQSVPAFDVVLDFRGAANLYRSYDDEIVGVFVPTWQKLEIGQLVVVTVEIDGARPITAHAVVQFARAASGDALWPGLGLAFVMLSEAQLEVLEDFARKRKPMFYDL